MLDALRSLLREHGGVSAFVIEEAADVPSSAAPEQPPRNTTSSADRDGWRSFVELGQTEIPAVVIEASGEDCYLLSRVENLARRQHRPLELLREVGALRERGYGYVQMAEKTGLSPEYVHAICTLLANGEHRLLKAVELGIILHSVALEIARSD